MYCLEISLDLISSVPEIAPMDAGTPSGRPAKPVSLKDVAQRAGVSYSLVSKVLRQRMGNTGVRGELREKIIRLANEMNYQPHPLAANFKLGRKGAVGVMLHPFGAPGSGLAEDFLRGVSSSLDMHGLRMWLHFFDADADLLAHISQRIRRDADGLIIAGVPHPATYATIKRLHETGLPVVTMFEREPIPGVPNVSVDRHAQGYLPTTHLLRHGCRRIAHIVRERHGERYRGALTAHAEAGIASNTALVFEAENYLANTGAAAVAYWQRTGLTFDAVLTQSDQQAFGAISALTRLGLTVPEQVRVTGVDDSPLAEIAPVPITSVTAEMAAVGRHTVAKLIARLTGTTPASELITPKLVLRTSA